MANVSIGRLWGVWSSLEMGLVLTVPWSMLCLVGSVLRRLPGVISIHRRVLARVVSRSSSLLMGSVCLLALLIKNVSSLGSWLMPSALFRGVRLKMILVVPYVKLALGFFLTDLVVRGLSKVARDIRSMVLVYLARNHSSP